jgi:hypothetical protein
MTNSRHLAVESILAHFQVWDTLVRVRNLIRIYDVSLPKGKKGRKPTGSTDVLRAAVVLLHSGLEEFLRALIRADWPHGAEDILNQVPLVGDGRRGRPEKFFLGKLHKHRGKTVDDLITESVREYLETTNFNNVGEIKSTLTSLGVELSCGDPYYASISQLTERRHQIVHRGDVNAQRGRGHHSTSSISVSTVRAWADAVDGFASAVGKNYTKKKTNA